MKRLKDREFPWKNPQICWLLGLEHEFFFQEDNDHKLTAKLTKKGSKWEKSRLFHGPTNLQALTSLKYVKDQRS